MTRTIVGNRRITLCGRPGTLSQGVIGRIQLMAFGTALLIALPCQAKIISLFNFNDMGGNNNGTTSVTMENAVGTPTLALVEDGGLLADQNGQAGISFNDQDGTVHNAGQSAGWTSGILNTSADANDYWLLNVDTTGYTGLNLRMDYRITNATSPEVLLGPSQLTIDWSAGGSPFTMIQTFNLAQSNSYQVLNVDLSGIAALQNATNVQLRGTWSNDGSESIPGGTFPSARLDNLELTGVPEPTAIALTTIALGVFGLLRRRHG